MVTSTHSSEAIEEKHVIPDLSAMLKAFMPARSRGEGVLSNLEVVVLLLLLKSQFFGFKRSELSAEGSCLLESEVVRSLLVILVGLAGSGDSLLAEDGEHSGDCLSNSL